MTGVRNQTTGVRRQKFENAFYFLNYNFLYFTQKIFSITTRNLNPEF